MIGVRDLPVRECDAEQAFLVLDQGRQQGSVCTTLVTTSAAPMCLA
jgi:hypothetical protein